MRFLILQDMNKHKVHSNTPNTKPRSVSTYVYGETAVQCETGGIDVKPGGCGPLSRRTHGLGKVLLRKRMKFNNSYPELLRILQRKG